jgi:hypothetical protein
MFLDLGIVFSEVPFKAIRNIYLNFSRFHLQHILDQKKIERVKKKKKIGVKKKTKTERDKKIKDRTS